MAGEPEGTDDPQQACRHGPVIDELLCFVTNKLSLLPPETIVQLCVSTYNASEIECSKKLLFQLLSDPGTQTRHVKRKGEKKNRDNIDDIIRLLQEKGEDVPKFAAVDLSRLPPITFDSVDVSVLLNSIKKMENEMAFLKDSVKTVHNAASMLKDTSSSLNARVCSLESNQVSPVPVNTHKVTADSARKRSDINDNVKEDSVNPTLDATVVETPTAAGDRSFARVAASNTDAWHTVNRNRQTRPTPTERRSEQSRKTNSVTKQRGVVGNAKESGLRTVGVKLRKANVFATRFDPEVTENDVQDHLHRQLGLDITVEAVDTKYNTYASFHITCMCPEPAVFMSCDLWPDMAFVRWWREPKKTVM